MVQIHGSQVRFSEMVQTGYFDNQERSHSTSDSGNAWRF
jgi:hypothetical protein